MDKQSGAARSALVVGGGSGIGYAAARRLTERGVSVVLASRRQTVLRAAQNELRREGVSVEICAGDAGQESDAARMVEMAVEKHGGIDVLVNTAGISQSVPFTEITDVSWRTAITSTLDAILFPAVAAARRMSQTGGGRIVLIGSIDMDVAEPGGAAYCAAKAAVGSITRSIAIECAAEGVRANTIAPGWVNTPMTEEYLGSMEPAQKAALNPLGRAATSDEIAHVVEYLALDAPDFLTGSTITVDGGHTVGQIAE